MTDAAPSHQADLAPRRRSSPPAAACSSPPWSARPMRRCRSTTGSADHRLWRHHAGRRQRPTQCSAAPSPSASIPTSRPGCRGNSCRSRTRSRCTSARWRPSTTRSSTKPRARSPRRPPTTSSPPTVGAYFDKINCFCFTEQTMKPGETREMTVVFYVDPAIVEGSRPGRSQHHHAVLYVLPAARARTAPLAQTTDEANSQALTETTMADAHANASRLSPGRSQPVAGGRRHLGLHPGGRRASAGCTTCISAAPLVFGARRHRRRSTPSSAGGAT